MGKSSVTQQHAPSYILKAKDWVISLTLVTGVVIASLIAGIALILTFSGDMALVLSAAASGIGALFVFGLYLTLTDRSLSYIDIPDVSGKAIAAGLLVGGVLTAVQAGLTVLFVSHGIGEAVGPLGKAIQERGLGFLAAIVAVNILIAAPTEELLYRNGIQKILSRHHSTAVAVIGAAFIFALPHVLNFITAEPIEILTSSFEIFVNGVGYGIAYAYWKRLDITIVAHAVYNCAVFVFAYLHILG